MTSTAVTIREHVRELLLDARPGGLSMAAIAGAVSGPWRENDVRDAVRRLWEINELGRRPDGTFCVLETVAAKSREKMGGAPQRALDARVKRVAAGARREGYDAKVRVRRVDPALLNAWCPRCRNQVAPRPTGACPKCATQTGANYEPAKPPRRRRRQKPLRDGQPGFGTVCRCGAPKSKQAHRCRACSVKRQKGRKLAGGEKRRRPKAMTEEQLLQARALYASGLSLRQVAAQLHPATTYATPNSCAEALYSMFKTRGWKLRPQREVTAARNFKHGRKARGRTNAQETAYRHWLAQQRGWKAVQGPGRPICAGVKVQPPGKGNPCEHHAQDESRYCFAHDPKRALQRQAITARMRSKLPQKPMLPAAPFIAWLAVLHAELGTRQAVAAHVGMSVAMAHVYGSGRNNGRPITRVGVAIVQRAAEHAGTTIDAIYGDVADEAAA